MSNGNVVQLQKSNYRQVVPTLKVVTEEIEEGKYGEVSLASIVLETETGIAIFNMGPDASLAEMVLSLQRAVIMLAGTTMEED